MKGALVVGMLAVALAGCTAQPHPVRSSSAPTNAVRWTGAGDAEKPVVVSAATAVDRSIAASRAFFRASPGVVVARDRDGASQRTAAAAAARLHVPLLLLPAAPSSATASPTTSASTSASTSATTSPTASSDALPAEVHRLGARWVAAVGAPAPRLRGVRTVRLARAEAPTAPASVPTVALASDAAADTAALATARAAGARVLDVGSADLASDGDAVGALAKAKQDRVVLLGSAFASAGAPAWAVAAARTGWQYPGGGQRPFDGRLWVALYGTPGSGELGVLGKQGTGATIDRVRGLVKQYAALVDRPVEPVLEVIATVASGTPTDDGDYSSEIDLGRLTAYADEAGKAHVPLILDLQPGRSDFLKQAKRLAPLLQRPGVGLALDPEWRLGPGQRPLVQIGRVSADEVNRTSAWLAGLVRQHDLPPKMFVLHQFRLTMLQDRSKIDVDRPELDTLIHVDGQGGQPDKQATWAATRAGAPHVAWGWKNFLEKDHPVLTPAQTVQQVHPAPDLITYQ